jgi:hypothetical protein
MLVKLNFLLNFEIKIYINHSTSFHPHPNELFYVPLKLKSPLWGPEPSLGEDGRGSLRHVRLYALPRRFDRLETQESIKES